MSSNPIDWLRLYGRASAASRYARGRRVPGMQFADFGRQLGWRLAMRAPRLGARYLVAPVDLLRHFEFDFACRCLPGTLGRCLDVSSPRLFSLYVASHRTETDVVVLNPSQADLAETQTAAMLLGLKNIRTEQSDVETVRSSPTTYDAIWSLSVVEHIAGAYDERDAVRWMFDALKPGGLLILTVPVDRKFWVEYRDVDQYGTQTATGTGKYFFQRFYDQHAITERLIRSIGREPLLTAWFGEKTPGRFHAFIAGWLKDGIPAAIESPRETADNYRTFESWEAMPGVGVVGLLFEKPR